MATHGVVGSASASTQSSNTIVGNNFKVGKKVGEGSFGVVFEGVNITNGQPVALKFEPRKSESPQLRDEFRSYRVLSGMPGFPQVYYFGQEGLHNVLVMDLFGPNLEDLFDLCQRKFSVKTVCMLAKQMVTRVQAIHDRSLIYRDIKPDNFLIDVKYGNVIHMVDFGMAKPYRDPKTRVHIPYRERKSLSGTARYMSINTHLGREQSRRDDLESLGHVFMYFLRGGLPWQGMKAATNKQKYEKIGEKKQSTPVLELCEGFPSEFAFYMSYVRRLGFEETPDYDYLRELFTKVLADQKLPEDGIFDWMLLGTGKRWDASNNSPEVLQQMHLQACSMAPLPPGRTARRSSHQLQNSTSGANGTYMGDGIPPVLLPGGIHSRHTSRDYRGAPSPVPPALAIPAARSGTQRYHPYNSLAQQSQSPTHSRPAGSNVAVAGESVANTMRRQGDFDRRTGTLGAQSYPIRTQEVIPDEGSHGQSKGVRRFLCCG